MRIVRMSGLGLLLIATLACDDGARSLSTLGIPTAPPPPLNVSGDWSGTQTVVEVTPHNSCLAANSGNIPGKMEIWGQAADRTVLLAPLFSIGTWLTFSGTLSETSLSAEFESWSAFWPWEGIVNCPEDAQDGLIVTEVLSGSLEGSFDETGSSFEGTLLLKLRDSRNRTFDYLTSLEMTKQ